jgi:N-acetylglutamate synthase-like GNAT family acetyltransferase
MAVGTRKIRRRRAAGELAVEQTRDLALVAGLLSTAGTPADRVEAPGGCYLVAYFGDAPVGAVAIEARVDAALIRSLIVTDAMRGRGIGAALISAARTAAHTRGARILYAIAPDDGAARFLAGRGFAPIAIETLRAALAGTIGVDYLNQHTDELVRLRALSLDIANDGVIQR